MMDVPFPPQVLVAEVETQMRQRGYKLHACGSRSTEEGHVSIWLFDGPDIDAAEAIAMFKWPAADQPPVSLIVAGLIGEINDGGSFLRGVTVGPVEDDDLFDALDDPPPKHKRKH